MAKPIRHTHRRTKDGTIKIVRTNTKHTITERLVNAAIDKIKGKKQG